VKFQELASVLPTLVNIRKPSKAVIVNKALDYYIEVKVKFEKKDKVITALRNRTQELREEVNRLREMLNLPPLPPEVDILEDETPKTNNKSETDNTITEGEDGNSTGSEGEDTPLSSARTSQTSSPLVPEQVKITDAINGMNQTTTGQYADTANEQMKQSLKSGNDTTVKQQKINMKSSTPLLTGTNLSPSTLGTQTTDTTMNLKPPLSNGNSLPIPNHVRQDFFSPSTMNQMVANRSPYEGKKINNFSFRI